MELATSNFFESALNDRPRSTWDRHLANLRWRELTEARSYLPAQGKLLELGGGTGFQALMLSRMGFDVTSIDVQIHPADKLYHKVELYDGVHLSFKDESFDAVFSSNVLEHVQSLESLLLETRRVLKKGGVAVHLMPSVTWRVFTLIAHVPALFKMLVARLFKKAVMGVPHEGASKRRTKKDLLLKISGLAPHGEFKTALHELWTFRQAYWQSKLQGAGFEVRVVSSSNQFYTGYGILPKLSYNIRAILARIFGGSCNVIVVSKH
jgi:ubiquinone/menaquinone biosynthesis C-methylase UbiE